MKLLSLMTFLTIIIGNCNHHLKLKEKDIDSINIHIGDCNILYYGSLSKNDIKESERIFYLEIENIDSIAKLLRIIKGLNPIEEDDFNPRIVLDVNYKNKSQDEIILDTRGFLKVKKTIFLDSDFKTTKWIKDCLPIEERHIINNNCMSK